MSILTNQHFDIPSYENGFEYALPGKSDSRRRFFQSVARWDARYEKVIVPKLNGVVLPSLWQQRKLSPIDNNLVVDEEEERLKPEAEAEIKVEADDEADDENGEEISSEEEDWESDNDEDQVMVIAE
jgi:histone deacetylase 1/2